MENVQFKNNMRKTNGTAMGPLINCGHVYMGRSSVEIYYFGGGSIL